MKTPYFVEAFTALGDEELFFEEKGKRDPYARAISWLREMTRNQGGPGWVIEHHHDYDNMECNCVQYLIDHHPVVYDGEEV